jgi:hypothetical protein
MSQKLYAIAFIRGIRTHYLKTRETNFARACKTLREMLKGNKRYKEGAVDKVNFDEFGLEKSMTRKYFKRVK